MTKRLEISFRDEDLRSGNGVLNRLPDECPMCHHKIDPNKFEGHLDSTKSSDSEKESLVVVFRCTHGKCLEIFLGYYKKRVGNNNFIFSRTAPIKYVEKEFPELVSEMSPQFTEIYNQASEAESQDLKKICGAGFRKALEFLIKDYLIDQEESEKEQKKIKKEFLGKCIEDRVSSDQIKKVSKRAAWLGNDETHYIRKWEAKDIEDLKGLIDLSVHWIEMELRTQQLEEDMPE